jgi:hypothetical protein
MMMGKLSFSLFLSLASTHGDLRCIRSGAVRVLNIIALFPTLLPVQPRVAKHPDTALSTPQDYASITK